MSSIEPIRPYLNAIKAGAIVLGLLLAAMPAHAGELVSAAGLRVARAECSGAGMDSSVQPNGYAYTVTCIARTSVICLSPAETYAVERCRKQGFYEARIEVDSGRARFSCVARP